VVFGEQALQEHFRPTKGSALQWADCGSEMNQPALGGKIKNTERTGDPKLRGRGATDHLVRLCR
jgi:hypothetical protein